MNALRHFALKTTRKSTRAFATGTRAKCIHSGLAKLPVGTSPGKFAWRPSSKHASLLQKRTFASNIPPPPPPLPTPFPVYVAGATFLSLGVFYASVRLGYVKDPFVGIEELEKIGNGESELVRFSLASLRQATQPTPHSSVPLQRAPSTRLRTRCTLM